MNRVDGNRFPTDFHVIETPNSFGGVRAIAFPALAKL